MVRLAEKVDDHQAINQPILEEIQSVICKTKNKKNIKKLPLRKGINKKEFLIFFKNAGLNTSRPLKKIKLKLIYFLLYYTGLRINETHAISIEHFKEFQKTGECQIYLPKTNQYIYKKLAKEGKVFLKDLSSEIEEHFLFYKYLGSSTYGDQVYQTAAYITFVNRDLKKICQENKLDIVSSHSFRIGLITSLLKEFHIQDVAKEMGHKSIESTLRYYRYKSNDQKHVLRFNKVFDKR
jgi:integrase